ncbi:hypothetical protein AHMF7605_08325 [Adhaeribacter arboris]|uniref:Uncharacterized protein n=1 Tax=Adhaeribacter arboris TaxID=2072846 RepID=A0A2T2YDD5_9BACT|nr:hypothetical protein [Adhaeribacter arboris]PSR53529.1 hypothetical protein AHMF7605_08325 [Adhaeribacter arboris]
MTKHFPLEFTLENGSHVSVTKTGSTTYDFNIKPEEGSSRRFTYVDDGRTRTEAEESLEFEEIDALRRFWLETQEIL